MTANIYKKNNNYNIKQIYIYIYITYIKMFQITMEVIESKLSIK